MVFGKKERPGSNRHKSLELNELKKRSYFGNIMWGAGFRTAKVKTNRFTVCPRWPLEYLPELNILMN